MNASPLPAPLRAPARLGRATLRAVAPATTLLAHASGVAHLLFQAVRFSTVEPWRVRVRLLDRVWPELREVGVRSLPIVSLIAVMIGAVMVLQTGDVLARYGQLREVPGLIALSMTRELGPLMTAITLIARVGSSFTAVIGSMKINDEVLALETMAVHPVGYLVAPRFLAMLVMAPCLVTFAFLLGLFGGGLVGSGVYDIAPLEFFERAMQRLRVVDVASGLVKGVVYGTATCLISCYFGLITRGGPADLGRTVMVSVVSCLVTVFLLDVVLTALFVNHFF